MSVSSVNNYRDVLFQWQGQQLKSSGTGSSSQSSAINALFGQASMTSQISSMVELTKYAMDAMGVGSNGRVTFTQITKYSQQLQSQFNAGVKEGFAASGISSLQDLTFSLGSDGKITVLGENEKDRKLAQAWFDANPDMAKKLSGAIGEENMELAGEIKFSISQTGKMTVLNSQEKTMQSYLDGSSELAKKLHAALAESGLDMAASMAFKFDADGNLIAEETNPNAQGINDLLSKNAEFADALKKELQKNNIDLSSVSITLNGDGAAQIRIANKALSDVQDILNEQGELGKSIYSSLDDLGIDPNINFSIQLNADGTINVVSDHPDRDKVQRFFEENPELVKIYRQIDTLAGVEDARKAMQISPSEMRKRIQVESMTAWWAGSGNANSYFGSYNNGNLSLLAGLNLQV